MNKVAVRNLSILAIALVGLRLFVAIPAVESLLHRLVEPISGAVESLSFSGNTETSTDQNIQNQIAYLKQENNELRQALAIQSQLTTADVIKKDVTGFRKSLIINKGSRDGISENQAVLNQDFLIGKIERVSDNTSIVMLITDPEFKVTASTINKQSGVVKNEAGSLVFVLVPETDLETKLILTDGVDGQMPPNIKIGTLGARLSSDDRTFHSYYLQLNQSPNSINQVQVVR